MSELRRNGEFRQREDSWKASERRKVRMKDVSVKLWGTDRMEITPCFKLPSPLLTSALSPQHIHLTRALIPGLPWPESLASATGLTLRLIRRTFR